MLKEICTKIQKRGKNIGTKISRKKCWKKFALKIKTKNVLKKCAKIGTNIFKKWCRNSKPG